MKNHAIKSRRLHLLVLCCGLMLAAGSCAMSGYYRVDLRYLPQAAPVPADSGMQKYMITAAQFNDERTGLVDQSAIGKRIQSDLSELKAVSQTMPPTEAVGAAIKDAFFKNGYTVFGGTPDWDGTERTIQQEWGTLVVGGFIEELEVVSTTGFMSADYTTKVKLRVVFGDVQHKRIISTATLESASSYQHFYFSTARLEQEINTALSLAIEKMFANNKIEEILDQIAHARAAPVQ